MRRTVMLITTMLAVAGLALPAAAAPPDGVPPSTPPGQGGGRPTPPGGGGSGGGGGAPPGTPASPVSLGIADAFVSEGITAQVTIAADAAPNRDVTVDWSTEDWTATAPGDYTGSSGTTTILAGETTATVHVPTVDDSVHEGNEWLRVVLSDPSANATIGDATAVVTIVDDDEPPPPSGECGALGPFSYPTGSSFHLEPQTVDPGACHELTLVGMPLAATVLVVLTSDDATSLAMEMVLGEVATVGTPTPSGQTLQFTKEGEGEPVLYVYDTAGAGVTYELVVEDVTPT